jgi:hypothetical protein
VMFLEPAEHSHDVHEDDDVCLEGLLLDLMVEEEEQNAFLPKLLNVEIAVEFASKFLSHGL